MFLFSSFFVLCQNTNSINENKTKESILVYWNVKDLYLEPIKGLKVDVLIGDSIIRSVVSNKKGDFSTKLYIDNYYKIVFDSDIYNSSNYYIDTKDENLLKYRNEFAINLTLGTINQPIYQIAFPNRLIFYDTIQKSLNIGVEAPINYFIDGYGYKVPKEEAKFIRKANKEEDKTWKIQDYYLDEKLQMVGHYKTYSLREKIGEFIFYYSDGTIKNRGNYEDGKKDGIWYEYYEDGKLKAIFEYSKGKYNGHVKTFWENDSLKRQDLYENGKFISGECYNSTGEIIEYYKYFQEPEFPNGKESLLEYFKDNSKYPSSDKSKKNNGKAYLKFVVLKDGTIEQIKVTRSTHKELEEEAIRLIKLMPKWKPAQIEGEIVDALVRLSINFSIR